MVNSSIRQKDLNWLAVISTHLLTMGAFGIIPIRRITISVEDYLADEFDELIERHGYQTRSEAFRDLVRGRLESERKITNEARYCVDNVSYIYNHHERELASRLAGLQHDNHDICVSTMHVHLDHNNCLETLVLRGTYKQVDVFANSVIAHRAFANARSASMVNHLVTL